MKKIGLIFCLLMLTTSALFGGYIEIGDGNTPNSYIPFYGIYDYSWSTYILTSQQLGFAMDINEIQFQIGNEPSNYSMENQQIYLKHTNDTEVTTTYPDPANNGFTLVYDGSTNWNGGGWQGVIFDTEFSYNGSSNLQIVWINNDGTYANSYPNFLKTETGLNTASYKYADNSFPAIAGSITTYFPNTRLGYTVENEPAYPTIIFPLANSVNIETGSALEWTYGENTEFIHVYLSDIESDVVNSEASALVVNGNLITTFSPSLENGKFYYWKVVASNSITTVISQTSIFSFSTEISEISEFPYNEGFENSWIGTPPAPLGWQQITVFGDNYWERSATNAHSGSYSAKAPYSTTGGDHLLVTPTINFDVSKEYRIKFWLMGHSSYPTDLKVQIASGNYTDETDFTTDLAYYITGNNMPTVMTEQVIQIGNYDGEYAIAFRAIDDDGFYVYLDDITIEEVPTTAVLNIHPDSINFGSYFQDASVIAETVTISNLGSLTSEITGISLSNSDYFSLTDENTYPNYIDSQSSITVNVTPLTTSIGLHQATLNIFETDPEDSNNTLTHTVDLEVNIRDNTGDNHHNPIILNFAEQIIENNTTSLYSNSYDFCTGPSRVYKLSLENPQIMDISLDGTTWDTKLWVFNSYESIDTATSNDDAWYYNDDEYQAGQGGKANSSKSRDRATWSKMNPTLAVSGDYYILISGFGSNEGDFIMTINFEGYTVPDAITYVSPADASTGLDAWGSLEWNASSYAEGYLVYLSSNSSFTDITPEDIQTTSYNFTQLDYSTSYYWKVIPYNFLGQTEDTVEIWSFTTGIDPSISLPLSFDFEGSISVPDEITSTNITVSDNPNGLTGNMLSKNIHSLQANGYVQFEQMKNISPSTFIYFDYRIVDSYYPWPGISLVEGHNYLTIKASQDGGNTFSNIAYINSENHNTSSDMANYSLDIGDFAGQRIVFRLEMDYDGINECYFELDNIQFREPYPILLEAQANIGSINLTWTPPTETSRLRDLTGYNVYRDSVQINTSIVSNTEYEDSDISHGHFYEYYIEALYQDEEAKESNRVHIFAMEYFLEGEGTEESPYLVEDLDDLYCLSITIPYWQSGVYIEQMADIDASDTQTWNDGAGFSPIGNNDNHFYGDYNGNGYVISNLYINREDTSRLGLFGVVYNGSISNIGITNVDFSGDQNVGALIGLSFYSTISKCFSTGTVSGTYSVGGLMGSCVWFSSLENSYSLVSVSGSSSIGGLIGYTSSSTISNSYSAGSVAGNTNSGGLIGVSSSTIENCFWDTESSNQATSQGGSGLETSLMQTQTTFTNAGWDFVGESANGSENIWNYVTDDYPHLSWEFIAPPQNLSASLGIGQITLSWTAPELRNVHNRAFQGYNIYRNDIQINESTIETTSFSDTNILNNQIYNYYVKGVFDEGESIKSNTLQINYSLLTGEGTSASPYLIEDLNDLSILSQIEDYWLSGTYFEQTADIDASDTSNWDLGAGFIPIGNNISRFSGNYNGNNFSINNLYINRETLDCVGLFGSVYDGFIENVRLEDVNILARSLTGALVGVSTNSDFARCSATGTISVYTQTVNNNAYAGGLIGRNSSSGEPSTILDCFTDVDIYALDTSARRIGGITGFMLSGWSDVTGYPMLIDNCYSLGSITGDQEIGGLVGTVQVHANGELITIKDSYSISNVPNNTLNGGIIGNRINSSSTINCFWNTETSEVYSGVGAGDETGIVQKTTSEMQTLSTYLDAGWDFQAETDNGTDDIWTFVANDYPHLTWEGYTNELTSPPVNLQASVEDGSITLTWSPPQEQTLGSRAFLGYNVYRDSIQINTEAILDTLYTDTDLVHDQSYTYYVRALYDEGESEASNTIDAQAIYLFLSGQGTESNPYLINDITDLYILSLKNIYWTSGTYIEQTADIDASDTQNWNNGAGFSPIGVNDNNAFRGNYNGNNFVISSLYINRPSRDYVGLFGNNRNATITNVCLEDSEINGADRVGGLLGHVNESTISNSYSTGSVSGNSEVGGLVGYAENSNISNSHFTRSVIGDRYVGGLVGFAGNSTISNSYSSGTINGDSRVGGLVGYIHYSTISNSYSSCLISGDSGVGGVAGLAICLTISNSYSSCLISGDSAVGGLVGDTYGNGETIEGDHSFWDTQTSNQNTSVGGGTGLTTAEMQTLSTYLDAGWDFQAESDNGTDDIWTFVANDYPHLAWEGYETQLTSPPVNLQATVDDGSITLTWSPPQNIVSASRAFLGYNVYRDSIQINTEAILNTLYTDTDLVHEQTYTYYVRALYDEGESEASNTIDVQAVFYILAGQGTESSPYLIDNLLDLYILSQANTFWGPGTYIEQTADIDASDTQNWDDGAGFSPIGLNWDNAFRGNYNGNNFVISSLYINRSSTYYVGLFGYTINVKIINVRNENAVITGYECVGGLVGRGDFSTINNSCSMGSVSGNTNIGGLVGNTYHTTINNGYSTGNVSGESCIGGIIGFSFSATINESYSTGSVNGDSVVGGLVGVDCYSTINNSYSTGSVSGESVVGGLVGNDALELTVNNSFWDTQTSNQATSAGGTGLTTAEMQTLSTYINAGWDFQVETDNGTDDIWTFVANDYPHLAWEGYETQLTSPPMNLQATVDDGSITLTWSPPQNLVSASRAFLGYNVYRDSIQINTEAILDTLYTDTDLVHDQLYTYYVRALYDEGESEASNTIDAQAIYLFLSGQGTESSPYLINNLTDLYILSQKNMYWALGTYIEQTADIDASDTQNWNNGVGFSPIGVNDNNAFRGNYNGNNFVISSLYINRLSSDYVGLFGNNRNATIINVCLEDSEINGADRVGGLLGQVYESTISNSHSTGSVSGNSEVGSLVGYADASYINECYSTGSVNGDDGVGGLVGFSDIELTINNSYSTGSVSGDDGVGGLVGFARESNVNNSYSTGSVSGDDGVGGLVGFADIELTINNSYSTGSVSGDTYVGGLVGYASFELTISNSYSTGSVSGVRDVGGLVGYMFGNSTVNNSFWDTESTNQVTSQGGGTGLTTAEMQTLSTYINAGWDFVDETGNGSDDIWKLPYEGEMYPLLSWQTNNLIALISADKTQAPVNESIQFTSNSPGNINYWEWDFDNDGFIDSYEENPIHSYSQPGYYSVVLTVSNDDLESDTCIYQNYIYIYNVDIQNGLYAYYPFNNNADDQSENDLDADVYGASLTTDRFGNEDSAYAFDGLDDYIDCPDGFADFTNGFTLTYWSYQESFSRWSRIIDFGNGSQSDNIILTPAALGQNSLQFQVYRGSSSDNIRIPNVIDLDAWTFWVAQVDAAGNAKVYKDNVLIGQDNIGIPNNILRTNNFIGRSNWASDGYYQGKIDDLRIYNRALYEEEIEELYNLVEAVEIPNNVSISSLDNQITISWDAVLGATSYKIFASDFPDGEFTDISAEGSFLGDPALVSDFSLTSSRKTIDNSIRFRNRISWVISIDSQRKFYRIKAVQ